MKRSSTLVTALNIASKIELFRHFWGLRGFDQCAHWTLFVHFKRNLSRGILVTLAVDSFLQLPQFGDYRSNGGLHPGIASYLCDLSLSHQVLVKFSAAASTSNVLGLGLGLGFLLGVASVDHLLLACSQIPSTSAGVSGA